MVKPVEPAVGQALVSSALGEAKDLSALGGAGDPALCEGHTATGIRTPVSGLRIGYRKPFAADRGQLRLDSAVEFDLVRWSRGHISGHAFRPSP